MRISNSLLQSRLLRDLQGNLANLAQTQAQLSSGKRFERMSEDPLAGTQVLTADRGLRAIEQYRRNSSSARARTDAEESVLSQMTDLISRAKELALQEGSAGGSSLTRAAAKSEVDRIIEQVVALGNTQVGSEYLFAGNQTTTKPFDAAGLYYGDNGVRQAEIGQNYQLTTNHTGQELLVSSGVLSSLQGLSTALNAGVTSTIASSAFALDSAFDATQTMLATNGARVRQIESAMQNNDALETSFTLKKTDAQGIDFEAATTRFVGAQNTLQAALLSTSKILNTSLTDYLR
jgi:flagellar hook-associated protein 3 FlgL